LKELLSILESMEKLRQRAERLAQEAWLEGSRQKDWALHDAGEGVLERIDGDSRLAGDLAEAIEQALFGMEESAWDFPDH